MNLFLNQPSYLLALTVCYYNLIDENVLFVDSSNTLWAIKYSSPGDLNFHFDKLETLREEIVFYKLNKLNLESTKIWVVLHLAQHIIPVLAKNLLKDKLC